MSENRFIERELLEKSDVFCMLPWIHLHVWPNGDTFPCCMANDQLKVGNTNQSSLLEIWNSENFRQLRKNMLSNKKSPECRRCYEVENDSGIWTLRQHSNTQFKNNFSLVQDTKEDGSLEKLNLSYLDIRWSNICNFKCRTCGPLLSSEWYQDHVLQYGRPDHKKVIRVTENEKFWEQFEPHLLEVEEVYFAGGEALFHEEHYKILDYWLKHDHRNVRIRYTTNFSTLSFKDKDILEYWKNFNDVKVAASLDDMGNRAEYSRKGTNWKVIEENRQRMLKECPHVYFEITPTLSLYNALYLPEFHKEWIQKGFLEPNALRVNILTHPEAQKSQVLTPSLKKELRRRYRQHITWLNNNFKDQVGQATDSFESIIKFTLENDLSEKLKDFFDYNDRIDKLRQESFDDVFPELKELRNAF